MCASDETLNMRGIKSTDRVKRIAMRSQRVISVVYEKMFVPYQLNLGAVSAQQPAKDNQAVLITCVVSCKFIGRFSWYVS